MWSVIGQVTSVLSLLAFVTAAVVGYLRRRLRHREQLLKSVPEAQRAGLVEAALDRMALDTDKLTQPQRLELALALLHRRGERFRLALMTSASVFLLTAALAVFGFLKAPDRLYRVRVTVLDLTGQPTDGARIRSSATGVVKQVDGGAEIEIAAVHRPSDGRIEIWATKDHGLSGHTPLILGEDFYPTVSVQLEKEETDVRGRVQDTAGHSLAGARVQVVGYEDKVITGEDGHFVLPAHVAEGEEVHLRVECEGFAPEDFWPLAGRSGIPLRLERR